MTTHQQFRCAACVTTLIEACHDQAKRSGWWTDMQTGEPIKRSFAELLVLIHSELSEAMEGYRMDLMDDHLPHRMMVEVELADVLIRVFDLAGGYNLDLGGALIEKLAYNAQREDHTLTHRRSAHGKSF